MGAYINPPDCSKEQWLAENATEVHDFGTFADTPAEHLPVVLVDNGWMTAAGICYSKREFEAFTDKLDRRPKRFFYAVTDDLYYVSRLDDYLPKEN